jgi:GntR family transcriptional regulator
MEPIDKGNPIPYYLQLAELMRRDISQRQPHHEIWQLPSENELATLHGITRATVRRALDVLERGGWLYREKGKGSFAAVRRVQHELTQLVSTTNDMRERGWSLTTKVISLNQMSASPKIASALDLPEGAPCYELCRLRLVDDEPLSLQSSYLREALCPALEEQDLSRSLYRLLETHYGLRLWSGKEILRARCALPDEEKLLETTKCAAVMYMERVTYGVRGEAVEYLEAVWHGERYDFTVSLSRPQT